MDWRLGFPSGLAGGRQATRSLRKVPGQRILAQPLPGILMPKRSFEPRFTRRSKTPAVDPLPRINDLIRSAKAGWLGLLAYLAYVGATLMGVIDADFFMPEKQTQLPLIGVSIPTTLFFAVSPLLGAMLFTYLHLYLLKLWEALAEAPAHIGPTPLGDHIAPWLVADFALSQRPDQALRPFPLRRLANVVLAVLVFAAAPAVLVGFWWRSMPKHDEALTIIACGIPLFATLYTASTSWLRLKRLTKGKFILPLWGRGSTWGWRAGFIALALMGWLTTEGTLEHYARVSGFYADQHKKLVEELASLDTEALKRRFEGITDYPDPDDLDYLADRELEIQWWMQTPFPGVLIPAQLAGTAFVVTPPDWLPYDQARHAFWLDQCRAEGLTPTLCGNQADSTAAPLVELPQLRAAWCAKTFATYEAKTETTCVGYFAALDARIAEDWKTVRANAIAALPKRDMSTTDLRFANLGLARMEGADLWQARMEGANLWQARMEGAYLGQARMEGASLWHARMEGAYLWQARMDAANSLDGANLSEAAVRELDLSSVPIAPDQVASMFGDGSVILPPGMTRPAHWPKQGLSARGFTTEYRKWRADPAAYTPPPPPAP